MIEIAANLTENFGESGVCRQQPTRNSDISEKIAKQVYRSLDELVSE